MLVKLLVLYYALSAVYIGIAIVRRKEGLFLRAAILISCPFISIFLLYQMSRQPNSRLGLPEWLLKRENYDDMALKSPDTVAEVNVIPFHDALMLNDNRTKRKMLIDLLKGESLKHVDALEQAIHNDDTETSHYAATAIQHAKSELLKSIRRLQEHLEDDETDIDALASYRDVLKHYIRIEFLDEQVRRNYTYIYMQTLAQLIERSDEEPYNYKEKIEAALQLGEHHEALKTADEFLKKHPACEDAYFSAMHVHFHMRNEEEFNNIMGRLRRTEIRLSPKGLNQLRFWLLGEIHEGF